MGDNRKQMEMMANYVMIPFIMGVPPIVGYYIGQWLDGIFDTKPYLMYVLLFFGVAAGIREAYRILMKYKDTE